MLSLARELLGRRALVAALVRRALVARYRGTVLGFLWSLVHPAVTFAAYALVFRVFVRLDVPDYAAFLFAGLVPWTWLASAVAIGTTSILGDAPFVRQGSFSPAIPPVVACLATGVHFALTLPLLLAVLWALGVRPSAWCALLPAVAAVELALCVGLTLVTAPLSVRYRDVIQLVQAVLPVWFLLTPIAYPARLVPGPYTWLVALNPMAHLAGAYQAILVHGAAPDAAGLLGAALAAGLLCWLGAAVVKAMRERIPEEL